MIRFIDNVGDYFSTTYFDEDFPTKVLDKTGYARDQMGEFNKRISPLSTAYFKFKQLIIEGGLRTKDKIKETHDFHTFMLKQLGYADAENSYDRLFHFTEQEALPIRHIFYRGDQVQLMVMEMQPMIREGEKDPDSLFEQCYNIENEEIQNEAQRYHRKQWELVFKVPEGVKISPSKINEAVSALFLLKHDRPKYILLLAGNVIFLLEQDKWDRGSYIKFDLEELFTEHQASKTSNNYALFYFLLSKESLAHQSNMVLLDQLDEDSHKSAYEVTKDLKEGIIHAVEALANEALYYKKQISKEDFDETDDRFEQEMKDDCLTLIYRLLFIFYAESRNELDILPTSDPAYLKGYSLEMLRDLEQVPMFSDSSRNGYFFHDSLFSLFHLLGSGYRENENGNNKSFRVRTIDSPHFDDTRLIHIQGVKFRNFVWQEIIRRLSLSREQRGRNRGRISYANLGINQLGSVYESLLAYRGFYAEQDYIEVHKAGKPEEGTYLVPRSRRDDFRDDEVLKNQQGEVQLLKKGAFVYRLSGRDRQKSASYYTPEVLTRCTVKYTLKPILERLDNKEIESLELLNLKLLEPAMGAAAFHNEMINQLAEAYLTYRQDELNQRIAPNKYREEIQKVKAYIATHNVYGVDINPTAIELGKLSLWLNVIHKDMETPFFSNRLGVGNAVVGAWLKAYPANAILVELDSSGLPLKRQPTKEWWETAPIKLEIGKKGILRKETEIYHFLLPDKNMLASAGIAMLKSEHPAENTKIREWKRDWIKPILPSELKMLQRISATIDGLLKEYYQFQSHINRQTHTRLQVFGVPVKDVQTELKTYHEKEELADYRNRHNAPYFKLKMVMDYWCALWFWDMRQAGELPTRQQYWQDIAGILDLDLAKATAEVRLSRKSNEISADKGIQLNIFAPVAVQLTLKPEPQITTADSVPKTQAEFIFEKDTPPEPELIQASEADNTNFISEAFVRYSAHRDFFDKNERIPIVQELALKYRFFHFQLEFLDVFWERGGFDLIAGNPPWLKITFEEKGIISEKFPEVAIRNVTAPEVRNMRAQFFADERLKEMHLEEELGTECAAVFLNAKQNYPLLIGQQTNLYKCVLENGFTLVGKRGLMGLLHPEGVYDDPNGGVLRASIYQKLLYHFQFKNSLMLFAEIRDQKMYSINVYKGHDSEPNFISINNLLHPSSVDQCFIIQYGITCPTLKIFDKGKNKYVWDLRGHQDRKINFGKQELLLIANLFENSNEWSTIKLPTLHSLNVLDSIKKLSSFPRRVEQVNSFINEGWHETNDVNNNNIKRITSYPDYKEYQMVYSGPHFFTGTSFYKTPRSICIEKSHYDVLDLTIIGDDFLPRSNYQVNEVKYLKEIKGVIEKPWVDDYRLAFRKMLNHTADRTLNCGIIPPKTSHINGVISIQLNSHKFLLELFALTSSIWLDFFVKLTGSANLTESKLKFFPLGIDSKFIPYIFSRVLSLACLSSHFCSLWEENFSETFTDDEWTINDPRLTSLKSLEKKWKPSYALRSDFARRWALLELDVIIGMALGMNLDDLIIVYSLQFPKWNEYESDNHYDKNGKLVFTSNSQGLVGIGVDSSVWDQIRNLSVGQTYEHTITKSELYQGKKITYHAPFDKCDRVEDYRVAWAHFEKVFSN
jgi:hypothetical protein